tara:strand:- start:1545 stop:2522 length:978 start_codon:yes stop_codon:yes gene_type:complete
VGSYQKTDATIWTGREDKGERFFNKVKVVDLLKNELPLLSKGGTSFALLGFCSDEGVRRNQGRVGSKDGPLALRKALRNKCFHNFNDVELYDCGDVVCNGRDLEGVQKLLGEKVAIILEKGHFPILLGGGHSISWGHYQGLEKAKSCDSLGVINIDAHYDLRPLLEGGKGSSGTPFLQIAERRKEQKKPFHYLCVGVQESANTTPLFETAKELGVKTILASDILSKGSVAYKQVVSSFVESCQEIYLTLCLDGFSFSVAPGVSAPSPFGIMPAHVIDLIDELVLSEKLVSFDIAEMAPNFDENGKTASLGAEVITRLMQAYRKET